jgi:hypothetical protein
MRPCPHCDGTGNLPSGHPCLDCLGKSEVHNLCNRPLVKAELGGCDCPSDDDVVTYRDKPLNPTKRP